MRIDLESLHNTRDLGGITTREGGVIREGLLVRSGMLHGASDSDLAWLREHVGVAIDLRTDGERGERPDPEIEDVRALHLPVLTRLTPGVTHEGGADQAAYQSMMHGMTSRPEAAFAYMEGIYTSIVTSPNALASYATLLDVALTNTDRAVLWHCTAGKDRAGIATILVLEALGADRDDIFADYLSTNEFIAGEVEQIVAMLGKTTGTTMDPDAARSLFGAREEFIGALYRQVKAEYGSFERFLAGPLGMGTRRIGELRDKCLR